MTIHMMQLDSEWYPAYHLEDFVVEVIVIADCPGWIKNVAGVHLIYLLDKAKVVAVALDLLVLSGYCYWIMFEIMFQESKCCK